jgi:signal transduction histidine kinase/FixJ family two-component response regulator
MRNTPVCSHILRTAQSWYDVILESDYPVMDKEWAKLLSGSDVSFELRLKQPFVAETELVNGEKAEGHTWIIASAYPEMVGDTVVGVLGCITDISRQKWMEGFQTRKMLEAVELKRQQENFIDMTSHEMRNPLSAIIQCADWIGSSLVEYSGEGRNLKVTREMAEGYVDAQTIVLCAQHDILTLSKLDSDLLLITPVEVRPVNVIQNALKMFDSELHKSDMELRFRVDPSYMEIGIDWVKLDPSRLLQVLINLTTNAIKFTQAEVTRKISVTVGASVNRPPMRDGLEYLPRSAAREDLLNDSSWGTEETVYLFVEVEDTGRGLSENERSLLFKRFHQASPRTHVQYGGSGLGLFISRELTELQGGQIGVSSKAGIGSTFTFYVQAKRCQPPEDINLPRLTTADTQAGSQVPNPSSIARLGNGLGPTENLTRPMLAIPKHVLIVEDNIVNQKVLSKQLRSAGCIVSVANHGEEALAFLATSQFWKGHEQDGKELAIVLMDLEMPVMDGLTCVKRIRELQNEGIIVRHLPIIAVTANARSEQIAVAKESGMDSVVTKPFRIPELLPEMERQVRKGFERLLEVNRANSAPP